MAEFEILAIGLDEADAPARFAKSFRETGFAILKDHNISADEIDRMYGVWTDFFASEEGPSFAVQPGESAGYFGYKSENAKAKTLRNFFMLMKIKICLKELKLKHVNFKVNL